MSQKLNREETKRAKEEITSDWVRDFIKYPAIPKGEEDAGKSEGGEAEEKRLSMGIKKRQLMTTFGLDDLPSDEDAVRELYEIAGENATLRGLATLLDSFTSDEYRIKVQRKRDMDELVGQAMDKHENLKALLSLVDLDGYWTDVFGETVTTIGDELIDRDPKEVWAIYRRLGLQIKRKDKSKEKKNDVVKLINRYGMDIYGVKLLHRVGDVERVKSGRKYTYRVDLPALQLQLVLSAMPEHVFSIDDKHPPKYDIEKVKVILEKMKKEEESTDEESAGRRFTYMWIRGGKKESMLDFLEWLVEGAENDGCMYDTCMLGSEDEDEGDTGDGIY